LANGVKIDFGGLLSKAMIGLCTLVLAFVVSWSSTISSKLDQHIGRRVHSGAALRETTDALDENQRLLWYEIKVSRQALRREEEHRALMDPRPLRLVPMRAD
jgi:hypothetical protein